METCIWRYSICTDIPRFLSYLWGMETPLLRLLLFCLKLVLILPMRNGNLLFLKFLILQIFCSYPTYEEWKPFFHLLFNLFFSLFLSYLWGMETLVTSEGEIVENPFLSYLWGMETTNFQYSKIKNWRVLILPMRNGNEMYRKKLMENRLGSYPTYEEWKPTLIFSLSSLLFKFLSYLWGMETASSQTCNVCGYKFLSYLWGMETSPALFNCSNLL